MKARTDFGHLGAARRGLTLGAFAAASLLCAPAHAALMFQFDFAGTFLTDPNGAAEEAAVIQAGQLYSSQFAKYFTNSGTVELVTTGFNNIANNNLANAGSYVNAANTPTPGFEQLSVSTLLQKGINLDGSGPVGVVNINFAYPFQLDQNAPVSGTQFDLYNILQHEFTHAVGFTSNFKLNGQGDGDFGNQYSLYDTFLANIDGTKLLNTDLTPNLAALAIAASTGVFFTGANAEAAYGGQPVPLFDNATPDDTGDASHTSPTLLPDDLMNPGLATGPAPANRMLSAIDVGILTDIGYTPVTAVPEPASYGMVLLGMVSVGLLRRRRSRG